MDQHLANAPRVDTRDVVVDPTLGRLRRRYFSQPADGPSRRAFTAARAARARVVPRPLRPVVDLHHRWDAACDRETLRRRGAVWI